MPLSSIAADDLPPRLFFRVPPEPSHLLRARERLRDYLRQYCTEFELIDDLVLCVEEACTNAIRHSGAGEDIEISLQFAPEQLVATVKDRGHGFDVESFDPRRTPDLTADHGRGLFIMATLVDSLELRFDCGLEVRMTRRAEPRCEPSPLESGLGETRAAGGVGHRDARTRAMLEEIDEAFFALDWEYHYLHANQAALRITRKSLDELLGHTPWELFPLLRGSLLAEHYREAMELGVPCVFEHRSVVTGDWLEVRIYPTPAGVSAYYREINERKRIEMEVLASRAELAATLAAITDGFYTLDRSWRVTYLNDKAAAVFPGGKEAVGANYWGLFPEVAGSAFDTNKRRAMEQGEFRSFESYYAPVDAWLEERDYPSEDGVTVLFTDVSQRHLLERERQELVEELQARREELQAQSRKLQTQSEKLQAQSEKLQTQRQELRLQTDTLRAHSEGLAERGRLAAALNDIGELIHSTLDFDDIMQRALEHGVRTLNGDAGAVEMRDVDSWVVRYQCGFSADDVGLRLSDGEAPVASLATRRREPLTIADTTADTAVNVGFVKAHSLKSVLAAPLIVRDAVIGCLLFYGTQTRAFSEAEIDFARKLGVTVSLAIENARLIEDEREATRLSSALNEINRLVHATLDAEQIMERVVAAAVAAVRADSAMIALRHDEDWVAEYGYPPIPGVIHESVRTDEAPFVVAAATSRRPVAIDDCDTDPRCIPEVQRRFGVRSVLCIPLIVRDDVIGVVFFNHHAQAVAFAPRTVDFAAKLAAAISAALENAQLYAAQQRIAITLQENFIHSLPKIAGLEFAAASEAASQPELVGGDFHDAFELPDRRVALLIGDVMGKGVTAAGLTETARTAVRALALTSPSPQDILPGVNRLLMLETDHLVTIFLALLDVGTGEVLLSSAGHPPPVHLSAAGATLIDIDSGPPLGAFERPYSVNRLRLAPGDALVLYTDGVTEARRGGAFFGEARLLRTLRGAGSRSPELLVDVLRGAVDDFADRLTDDLDILAVRLVEQPVVVGIDSPDTAITT